MGGRGRRGEMAGCGFILESLVFPGLVRMEVVFSGEVVRLFEADCLGLDVTRVLLGKKGGNTHAPFLLVI